MDFSKTVRRRRGARSGFALSRRLIDDEDHRVGNKVIGLYAVLAGANLLAWGWALAAFHGNAVLLATALLAYGLGLRHAIDADHIAAIDNVTRKLIETGKRPISVGFFFALGHSTVVVVVASLIALTATTLQQRHPGLIEAGGLIGTAVSALFLFAIAIVNVVVLRGVYRRFRRERRGGDRAGGEFDTAIVPAGLLGRLYRRLFRLVTRSWHMYPLGLLFGLGFETASEVGLLGLSASGATSGLGVGSILVFPALFTAGMSLVDTTDGVLMLGAYGWAFVNPLRKLYYNLTITALSVVIAVVIGGVEALGLIAGRLGLEGGVWDRVAGAADNFGVLGYWVLGIFAASWLVSFAVYRLRGYDKISV